MTMVLNFMKSPITVAWFAVLISFSQLILSVPLLTNFYSGPKMLVEGASSSVYDPMSIATYTLSNNGKSVATNVEIGFTTRIGDRILVMPDIAHTVTTDKAPLVVDHARLEFPRILPSEDVVIIVSGSREAKLAPEFLHLFQNTKFKNLPSLGYLRSDQGSGAVKEELNNGAAQEPKESEKSAAERPKK
jgi:hypothetical protein